MYSATQLIKVRTEDRDAETRQTSKVSLAPGVGKGMGKPGARGAFHDRPSLRTSLFTLIITSTAALGPCSVFQNVLVLILLLNSVTVVSWDSYPSGLGPGDPEQILISRSAGRVGVS